MFVFWLKLSRVKMKGVFGQILLTSFGVVQPQFLILVIVPTVPDPTHTMSGVSPAKSVLRRTHSDMCPEKLITLQQNNATRKLRFQQ